MLEHILGDHLNMTAPPPIPGAPEGGGALFKLATRIKPKHQRGGRLVRARGTTPSGHEQHEWTCAGCGLVRVTVLPVSGDLLDAEAYRAYRWGAEDNARQFECDFEPECVPTIEGKPS